MNGLCRIGINLVTVVALAAGAVTAQGQDQELASEISDVLLFDTGAALAGELPSAALAEKAGWVKVEKDAAPGQFKGDAVFLNGRIAVVLRKGKAGAEIYSHSAKGWQRRALLAPAKAARLRAVKILAGDPDAVSVEAVFAGALRRLAEAGALPVRLTQCVIYTVQAAGFSAAVALLVKYFVDGPGLPG